MIRRTLLALALSLLAWSAISVIAEARKPQTHQVVMDAMVFRPASLTVRKGDTIVWINEDVVAHTATSASAGFDSNIVQPGKSWKHTVRARGDFAYVCTYHPRMKGTLRVK